MTTPPVFSRLRERKLVQWALAYLAGAWLVLQVLDVVGDKFGRPDAMGRGPIVLLAVGFLAALVLAWYHGEKGRQRVTGPELVMIGVLCLIAATAVAFVSSGEDGASQASASPDAAGEGGRAPSAARSVAVLPFLDLSPEKDQEHFVLGLSEEVLNALTRVPGLRVPARTSSFAFHGQSVAVAEIARQLDVTHVLEGSVRKAGERVRITAQLIDTRTDTHLWSHNFDRELTDVFAVQEEIARAIADVLKVRLAPAEAAELSRGGTRDPRAQELYLEGRYLLNLPFPDSLVAGIELLEQATELDPSFARAWGALGLQYVAWLPFWYVMPASEAHARGAAALERALELEPGLEEALLAQAELTKFRGRVPEALAALRSLVARNPGYADAHSRLSLLLAGTGKLDEAVAVAATAADLDPLNYWYQARLSFLHVARDDLDEARRVAERIEPEPFYMRSLVDAMPPRSGLRRPERRSRLPLHKIPP